MAHMSGPIAQRFHLVSWCVRIAFICVIACGLDAQDSSPPVFPESARTVDVAGRFRLLRLWPTQKLDCPVALGIAPGSPAREVVLLQRGEAWLLPEERMGGEPERVLDLRDRIKGAVLFEEGCHGIAFHPDFADNGRVFISYSATEPRRTVLSELKVASMEPLRIDASTERVLLETPHIMANHFGGGLAFGPDRKLYFTIGDGGLRDDPYHLAQNPFDLHGKMLRIDVDARSGSLPYGIPQDNPFADKQEFRSEIYALGLRNPWGFSFDPTTGDLWLADVGQDLWEEVNLIKKGANYGWSDRDGANAAFFHAQPFLPDRRYTPPAFAYTHAEGVSVTGGFVYRSEKHPALTGCFLCADWGHGTIWALRHDADQAAVTERLILLKRDPESPPFNPTLIAPGADGEPLIMSQEGAIYTLIEGGP